MDSDKTKKAEPAWNLSGGQSRPWALNKTQRERASQIIIKNRMAGLLHSDVRHIVSREFGIVISRSAYYRLRKKAAKIIEEDSKDERQELCALMLAQKQKLWAASFRLVRKKPSPMTIMASNAVHDSKIRLMQSLGLLPKVGQKVSIFSFTPAKKNLVF